MSEEADELRRLVFIHDRLFQQYSVQRRIYCVPVDEVCAQLWNSSGCFIRH